MTRFSPVEIVLAAACIGMAVAAIVVNTIGLAALLVS
jgi:hypothetical protein